MFYFIEVSKGQSDCSNLDTREYKELEGVGRSVSDLVLTLLLWMVDEERKSIRSVQREGIEIAKRKGKYKGRKRNTMQMRQEKIKSLLKQLLRN